MSIIRILVILSAVLLMGGGAVYYPAGHTDSGRYERWHRISRVQLPDLVLHREPCPWGRDYSCAIRPGPHIYLHPLASRDRFTFMHEACHVLGWKRPNIVWHEFEEWADVCARCTIASLRVHSGILPGSVYVGGFYVDELPRWKYRRACKELLNVPIP